MRPKNHDSPATASPAPASTHRLCGSSVAPNRWIGWSPENAGSACTRLSHTSWARPRRNSETPIVMMISVTVPAWRAGSIASFSTSSPTITAAATASSTATGSGRPVASRLTALMPPTITNSPCAKLIAPLAL